MAQIETVGILEEIEALVSDKVQVVSYKWLSRNFLVSSNDAKRLLNEFVEKSGNGLEVVYALSGWLKDSPTTYHIKLVSATKLKEAKQEFNGNCSVQVYSVQASIPEDPASIWNAEYVQAEELFKQPSTVDNCLRDNRFCGISNDLVKRTVDGQSVSITQPKKLGIAEPSRSNFTRQNNTVSPPQQSGPTAGLQSAPVVKNATSETNSTSFHDQSTKPTVDKEKNPPLPANRKKSQNDRSSSGTEGSLSNLWGRALTNSKPNCALVDDKQSIQNPTDAQVQSREAEGGGSDDDALDIKLSRGSNGEGSRKRRVFFDYSDEEYEDTVSLASPEVPKSRSSIDAKQTKKTLISEEPKKEKGGDESAVKKENANSRKSNQALKEGLAVIKNDDTKIPSLESNKNSAPENEVDKKDKVADAPQSPKRRKVMKTRIDERGREVTEVVWEGEETDKKKVESEETNKVDNNATKKSDTRTGSNAAVNRPQAVKKSPALGNTGQTNTGGKPGNKKAVKGKDPKQGNILSFFKKA